MMEPMAHDYVIDLIIEFLLNEKRSNDEGKNRDRLSENMVEYHKKLWCFVFWVFVLACFISYSMSSYVGKLD